MITSPLIRSTESSGLAPASFPSRTLSRIEHGDPVQTGGINGLHVIFCNVLRQKHTVQGAVVVGDGDSRQAAVFLQDAPGPAHGDGGAQNGRGIVFQVPDLGIHGFDENRRLEAEAVQNQMGFVADVPQPGGLIFPVPQGVAQGT